MRAAFLIGMIALIGVTACSRSERDTSLHDLKTYSGTPEEFSIIPAKPLVQPENYADLPTPTPGQGNRTDQTKGRLRPRATQQIVLTGRAMEYATRVQWSFAKAQDTAIAIRDLAQDQVDVT